MFLKYFQGNDNKKIRLNKFKYCLQHNTINDICKQFEIKKKNNNS